MSSFEEHDKKQKSAADIWQALKQILCICTHACALRVKTRCGWTCCLHLVALRRKELGVFLQHNPKLKIWM